MPNAARSGVVDCAANTYSTGASDTCTDCSGGHSGAGASSCVSTPPGQYWNGTADVNCPAGTFSSSGASNLAGCAPCDGSGQFSPTGSSYCSTAGAGTKPNDARGGVENCPPNTFSEGESTTCTGCPANSYSNEGSLFCYSCLPGQRYNSGSTSISKCADCAVNEFNDDGNGVSCESCPANSYGNTGSSSCYVCAPGHEYDDTMTVSADDPKKCAQCPISKFSAVGVSCEICAASSGYVQHVAGSASCNYCGLGQFADMSTNMCVNCPASKYSTGGGSSCTDCESGKISASAAQSTCAFCDAGQVPNSLITACESCPAGKMSNIGGERPEATRNIYREP